MLPLVNELTFGTAAVAGLVAGLSPCTLPTAALIVGYVGGSRETSKFRCFLLSFSFVLGLSLTLAALGLLASGLGTVLLNLPYVYTAMGILMILMGLIIMGVLLWQFGIRQETLQLFQRGRAGVVGAFLLGIPFAAIASPCTIPITTAVLALAATKANLLFGFWLLLVYALGRSFPLLLAGTFTGMLKSFARSQPFLQGLQKFSTLVLIGLGIYFIIL
jgi:cytochrome c biogenesis protein CcdA